MLDGASYIAKIANHYPEPLRAQIAADLRLVLQRDRRWLLGQWQIEFGEFRNQCAETDLDALERLRQRLDAIVIGDEPETDL